MSFSSPALRPTQPSSKPGTLGGAPFELLEVPLLVGKESLEVHDEGVPHPALALDGHEIGVLLEVALHPGLDLFLRHGGGLLLRLEPFDRPEGAGRDEHHLVDEGEVGVAQLRDAHGGAIGRMELFLLEHLAEEGVEEGVDGLVHDPHAVEVAAGQRDGGLALAEALEGELGGELPLALGDALLPEGGVGLDGRLDLGQADLLDGDGVHADSFFFLL